jgi:histidinol-phosphate aminotransferase
MTDFIRSALRTMKPYSATDAGSAIDLSDNTNLWGTPPASIAALRALEPEAMTRYPATPPAAFNRQLAAYAGVPDDWVVPGCGSDDLLDCAMRAFAEPGDTIALAMPTFSMIPAFAAINGLRVHAIPLRGDFDIDVDALLAPAPRIVYLCSPNNPTGTGLSRDTIERVIRRASGVVLLDEAYGEFTSAPGFDLVTGTDKLVVTRTLSKAFGLAGLRIGYAVLPPTLARALETVRGPYKLNAAAAAAAGAALSDGLLWVRERVAEAVSIRARLDVRLRAAGLSPLPSAANFLCLPCRRAPQAAAALLANGLAVRVLRDLPPITPELAAAEGRALRIAVGPWPVMERLLGVLESENAKCE